jgi:dienelactone hydrolase
MRTKYLSFLVLFASVLALTVATVQTIAQEVMIPSQTAAGEELQLPANLQKPNGNGPFPAVVMLCGCGGIVNGSEVVHQGAWARRLVGWGYVAVQLDSFSPRGPDGICEDTGSVSDDMRSQDAFAAKAYLSTLPFVDPNRIAVIGFSHGAWAVMRIIDGSYRDKKLSPFKAAVAFYPYCHPLVDPDTPVLTLVGKKDDWCPAALAESLDREYKNWNWKTAFVLRVYPNATHGFDDEGLKGGVNYLGHHLDYDSQATPDAIARTRDFLAKYVGAR